MTEKIQVNLVTTWDERCGIAEYARNLVEALRDRVDFRIIGRPLTPVSVADRLPRGGITHLNHEPGLFRGWTSAHVRKLGRTICTWHTSFQTNNLNEITNACERVIVHEMTEDDPQKFLHIPHGIYDRSPVDETDPQGNLVGTVGFPFPWKAMDRVVVAARRRGMRARVIIPRSGHANVEEEKKKLLRFDPEAEILTDWMTQEKVIQLLQECRATVFSYLGGHGGVSGAVRMGLAAGRPTVVSHCRQFRDLFDYGDELYVMDMAMAAEDAIETELKRIEVDESTRKLRRPKRILQDMSWTKTAERYYQVYRELN